MIGAHGMGVSTPRAAEVAAATAGFASDVHMPNGTMFWNGTQSRMVATGCLLAVNRFVGGTTNIDGATPKLHASCAPITTTGLPMSGRYARGAGHDRPFRRPIGLSCCPLIAR
jgi:hypothetical protein